jgi:hypothetical protein
LVNWGNRHEFKLLARCVVVAMHDEHLLVGRPASGQCSLAWGCAGIGHGGYGIASSRVLGQGFLKAPLWLGLALDGDGACARVPVDEGAFRSLDPVAMLNFLYAFNRKTAAPDVGLKILKAALVLHRPFSLVQISSGIT